MAKSAHVTPVPPYQRPDFAQGQEKGRPMDLLTEDTKHSGCLVFRYRDDGTTVAVPNIPANQPIGMRLDYLKWSRGERILSHQRREASERFTPNELHWFKRDHEQAISRLDAIIVEMERQIAAHQGTHVCFYDDSLLDPRDRTIS